MNYFEIRTHSYIESVRFLKFLISIYVVSCMNKIWGIERSGFFNGREKWAKGFENQRV